MAALSDLKIGNSVAVKSGAEDPDFGIDMAGWQGRVVEIKKAENLVCIAWDSITLKRMPEWLVEQCETEGLDWRTTELEFDDLALADPRDTTEEVEAVVTALKSKYGWLWLGEEGKRIQAVLQGIPCDDYWTALKRWKMYLLVNLHFPFDAEIHEADDRGPLHAGDRVRVKGISLVDDTHGVIVAIRLSRKRYDHPLFQLRPVDQDDPNYQIIEDYDTWFSNC